MSYWWVALGGALGSMARFAVAGLAARSFGTSFPWGTLIVNVAGSFAIGLVAGWSMSPGRPPIGAEMRNFVVVGVLGGFTTFSAFSIETLNLARAGSWGTAGANVIASVALSLIAAAAGVWIASAVAR